MTPNVEAVVKVIDRILFPLRAHVYHLPTEHAADGCILCEALRVALMDVTAQAVREAKRQVWGEAAKRLECPQGTLPTLTRAIEYLNVRWAEFRRRAQEEP